VYLLILMDYKCRQIPATFIVYAINLTEHDCFQDTYRHMCSFTHMTHVKHAPYFLSKFENVVPQHGVALVLLQDEFLQLGPFVGDRMCGS
jgi:hypothetical protein